MSIQQPSQAWIDDCEKWRGRLLTGDYAHWCDDWDGLPIDETTPEWPCACADQLMCWKLCMDLWPVTPQPDLDSVWQAWYACGMPLHIRFVCKTCKRQITGCSKKCEAPDHRTEEVESCAVCAQREQSK
jgi:hypothetical protein